METIYSFAPVARCDARLLILGSMPGKKSLAEQQYYAHPRNAFWKIAAELFGFDADAAYERRKSSLMDSGVALWDVMAECTRGTSLDSDIVESTIVTNDFAVFFSQHHKIRTVCFNGLKAAHSFRKFVQPDLGHDLNIRQVQLPSSSPANAGMSFEQKLEAWRAAVITR